MVAHRVAAVELLDADLAAPLGRCHRRIAGVRKLAIVDVAAHPERLAVQINALSAPLKRTEAEADRTGETGTVRKLKRVKPRMPLAPVDRLAAELYFDAVSFALPALHLQSFQRDLGELRAGGKIDLDATVCRPAGEHPRLAQRVRFAQFKLADDAVPARLRGRSPRVRPAGETVLGGVVDGDFKKVLAGSKFARGEFINVRSAERIARADSFSVDFQCRLPHDALHEELERL